MIFSLLLSILLLAFRQAESLSNPLVNPTNANFQAGLKSIISSVSLGTTMQTYQFLFANAMANNTLKGAIGIASNQMSLSGQQMGFEVVIVSVDSVQMFLQANAYSNSNPITKMTICYMVTYYVELHINYATYVFNPLTDAVSNYSIPNTTACPSVAFGQVECRNTYISLPYALIGNIMKGTAMISGFAVNSFKNGMGINPAFGLCLSWITAGTTSLGFTVFVVGRPLLTSISVYYLSYDQTSLNIYANKFIAVGTATVGCSMDWTLCQMWDSANINTTFTTSSTGFNAYYSSNYFYGFSGYMSNYDSTSNYGMDFAVSGTIINGTSYQTGFSYYGNFDGIFSMSYSYLIILEFYCADVGVDIYYVLGLNQCNSTCNGWISQYADANRICTKCDPICYKCSGASYLCDDCYISQNRIVSGQSCICNPVGFYNDGSSLTCPKCQYSCRSCTGPSASQCIDCTTTSHRTIDINSCFCNPRYYDNGATICASCHYTCLTCSGNTATSCLTCALSDFRTILSTNNSCPCMVRYYSQSSPNSVCALCHYSCWTCTNTGPSSCSSCNSTEQFRNAFESSCPCINGYFDNNTAICVICHVTCATCDGPTQNDCLSCDNLKFRSLQSGQCKCKTRYYDFNLTCYACHYTCHNCTAGTMYDCVNCNSAVTFRNYNGSNGACYCIDGYTDVGVTQCGKCDRTCLTCLTTLTTCITCDPLKFRTIAGTTCPCIIGYVDTGLTSGLCLKCHYSCITCSGTASTQCLSCNTTWRTLSGGSCLCNTHTYDNGITVACSPCNQQCLQCSDQYDTTCTQCDPLYLRQIVGTPPQPCTCIQRYFENNGALLCDSCHYSCLTCSTISTNCTSCDSTTDYRYASGNLCLCMSHYYEVSTQTCASCVDTCLNCSVNPNNCTSCYSDRHLIGNQCFCNNGTYADILNVCQPCNYYCKTCQNFSTTCTSCPLYTFRTLTNASCPCDFGYYDNSTTICVKCSYQCSGCTGPDPPQCITCPLSSQRTLQPDKSCPCNTGFYDDGVSPTCKLCKNTCLTCSSYSVCTSCYSSPTQYRTLVSGSCKCISGYYDNLINPVCQLCHYSCASCSGGLSTNCITCKANRSFQPGSSSCPCQSGFYEAIQICYSCDSSCKTCTETATNCTSCDLTLRYLLNNKCLCRQGYFDNGGICSPCDISCGSCVTSSTNCLSCNSSQFTILNGSTCTCSFGQYQDSTTLICNLCSIKCQSCTNAGENACLTCRAGTHRTFNSVSFSCGCDPGYFDQGYASCTQCDPSCMTCYGPTNMNCSTCYPGAVKLGSTCSIPLVCTSGYYYDGFCLTACPNTTFPSVNHCQPCINNCKTCNSATICTSCIQGFFFNSTVNTCNINCPQGAFINWMTRTCDLCPRGCVICSQRNGSVVCPQCQTSYYLFNHSICVDSVFCSLPHFVIVGFQCFSCQYPCETCNNISFNGCIACKEGFSLYNGECISICPIGYYSFNKTCLQCDSRCQHCSSTTCELCKEGFYLTMEEQNPKCIEMNHFLNPSTGKQEKCHPNCYSCTNSSFSSCISCQKYRGDESQMAISGYCDCWEGSIDIANGECSIDGYEQVESYVKVLKSSTDSALYTAGIASVLTGNFLPAVMFMLYQQSYSLIYFINNSAVLQTQQYAKQTLTKNINFYLNTKSKDNNESIIRYSRLLVSLQSDISLFSRGDYVEVYLFNWGIYTVILLGCCWLAVVVTSCLVEGKKIKESDNVRTVLMGVRKVFQESAIIVINLMTICEISLYGTATFKFILFDKQFQINWIKFSLSAAFAAYYLIYILRLIIGTCRIKNTYNQQKATHYNPLTLLTVYFDLSNIQTKTKSKNIKNPPKNNKKITFYDIPIIKILYIPLLMIRLAAASVVVIYFSSKPFFQAIGILSVAGAWAIYSFVFCPYEKLMKVFIHITEIVFLGQAGMVLYSVMQAETSRMMAAYVSLILNGVQIGCTLLFSILLVGKAIYGICQQMKGTTSNRVQNIYFSEDEVNNSQANLNENKNEDEIREQLSKYEMEDNIFDHDLMMDHDKMIDDGKMKKIADDENNKVQKQKHSQIKDEINQESIKQKKYDSQDMNNISKYKQEQENNQKLKIEQEENVIIKKKYRAVRRNKT